MNRREKLKLENIKKANENLEIGHNRQYPKQEVVLKPSENVTNSSKSFVNKMNNLNEGVLNEEPEKETYWMITKSAVETLKKFGNEKEDEKKITDSQIRAIGGAATDNFQKYCK
jgi:hypothetical protein|tara:strand:+ start:764 stop:1105 length:342 start_codon:yes stop_codon:yes gene_type:complete